MMNIEEVEQYREILEIKKRRLHELQLQKAGKGSSTEPHILIEIKDYELEIAELQARIASLSLSSDQKYLLSLQALPSPLAKYDDFLKRLFERCEYWNRDGDMFKQHILASLSYAAKAESVFIVRHTGDIWEASEAKGNGKIQQKKDSILQSSQMHKILDRSSKYYRETKVVNNTIYTNVLHVTLQPDDQHCILVVLPNTNPLQILLFVGVELDFMLDSVFSTIINSILYITNNFSIPEQSQVIESAVYNAIRQQFGYVSDYVYYQQLKLFRDRLNRMTVYFEPIVELSKIPYIWRWEALARDPQTEPKRAPIDLFETAKIWGRHFQVELDMHFLQIAVEKYGQGQVTEDGPRKQIARYDELPPLHVNIYPESIVRRLYRETMVRIEQEKNFPLSKLVLEISEKLPLPVPESSDAKEDDIKWFRDQLKYYTDQGISFAIDDFGVGYASTSRLSRIEPEFVKIDRDALLHHLGSFTLEYARRLVSESIGKMKMVVEGFDDQSKFTLAELYDLKIRYVQGHVFGRAQEYIYRLSPEEEKRIAALLKKA
jgi:EAL domain-containing protein (putative c-di-GMP-specific phosphodiesterase class I)